MLPGPGGVVGDALVSDPRVAKIIFTGETTTGASILKASADNITRVSLELGGKSACVVFADADLTNAPPPTRPCRCSTTPARTAAPAAASWSSARPTTTSSTAFVAATDRITVGEPLDEATEIGPDDLRRPAPDLARLPRHRRRRGRPPRHRRRRARPARATTCPPPCWPTSTTPCGSPTRRSSVRSPAIIPFDDEADAVRIANDSAYGLSGSLWTGSSTRAIRVAKALRTGTLSVNTNRSRPHRGAVRRLQALGPRPRARHGTRMDHYTEVKNVFFSAED